MDGRSLMATQRALLERVSDSDVKEKIDSEARDAASDDEADEDGEDSEMVLSKDDFLMLQAFHRFVPLPALSSRIVRLLCEEDLQVDDEEDGGPQESAPRSFAEQETPTQLVSGLKAVRMLSRTSLASQSPLTKRLSTKSSSQTLQKPRREVNLAAQTPRIKRVSASIDLDERTG